MSLHDSPADGVVTTASDYAGSYYNDMHLGGAGDYDWSSDHWRTFFRMVADRIVGLTDAGSVLDVGCAKGLLVQALAERGVDAAGTDISEHAVETAHEDVRPRLRAVSAVEPIDGRYDLVTCIEVLEHMSNAEAQQAIDSMCAATDRILFSSSPADFHESTHINTHSTGQWAAWFAERGFYRDASADTSFLTRWAILFERRDASRRALVEQYEAMVAPLIEEVSEKRLALLEATRRLESLGGPSRVVELDDRSIQERHADLVARDHVMGLEARATQLDLQLQLARTRIQRLRRRAEEAEDEVRAVRASRTWRVGRVVTGPVGRFRR